MRDDKTDQSWAGPLFDKEHRQIELEDLIKAAELSAPKPSKGKTDETD